MEKKSAEMTLAGVGLVRNIKNVMVNKTLFNCFF